MYSALTVQAVYNEYSKSFWCPIWQNLSVKPTENLYNCIEPINCWQKFVLLFRRKTAVVCKKLGKNFRFELTYCSWFVEPSFHLGPRMMQTFSLAYMRAWSLGTSFSLHLKKCESCIETRKFLDLCCAYFNCWPKSPGRPLLKRCNVYVRRQWRI